MRKYLGTGLLLAGALFIGACDDSTPTGEGTGSISMLLTDAPGDFARAIVTIDRVVLVASGAEEDDELNEEQNGAEGGIIVLRDEEYTTDLLELSNDVDEIVEAYPVPEGSYSEVRFVISGGCVEVENETGGTDVYASSGYDECGAADGSLQMPSYGSSGLKVKLPSGFRVEGQQNIVLLDFNVAESFGHQAGNSGQWVMRPVIHATEIQFTGGLDVAVQLADTVELPDTLTLADFAVRIDEEPPVTLLDGLARFHFMVPATYSVDVVAPEGYTVITDPETPFDFELDSGVDGALTITILEILEDEAEEEGGS